MGFQINHQRRLIMVKKSFSIFILILCLGLFLAGCPKKTVKFSREQPSAQKSEEARRLEAERAAREAREAKEAKEAREVRERELATIKEEEAKKPIGGELEKSLVAKKESGIEGEVFESKLFKDIHFDFDKYDISREDEAILRENAAWLKKNPKMKIQVEGHCDERGTAEYNLALGERRANMTKKYLVSLGVASDRISTISYGEERPLDPGHNEEAWGKNRRAHIVVLSK
jgi:peptidoglycan-associated lipoprotein